MLLPNLTGNLFELTNRQPVELVRMSDFTDMHTGLLFELLLD
jgi:hypothetical protein